MSDSAPRAPNRLGVDALGDAVLAREPGALERAIALATSADPDDREAARAAVDAWAGRTGKSLRVALLGRAAPAADALARHLEARGHRVAVLRAGTEAPQGGAPADAFAAVLPEDGCGAADAIRACEIGGHDALLIALGAGARVPLETVSDCRVGDGAGADVAVDLDVPFPDDALEAAWAAVRRWHWEAVESGAFAARRAEQKRRRETTG